MTSLFSDARRSQVITTAYETAMLPERWPDLLQQLGTMFRSPFADIFSRTADRSRYHGVAIGLDRNDYQDQFLGIWMKRNVWAAKRPVTLAGEVVTTRDIMPRTELLRSEMYAEYLAPRDLHEGLRLSVWAGQGWLQYVSLLRPWSAGPFGASELAMARELLPHLQGAAAVAQRLRGSEMLARAGLDALDSVRHPALILDCGGKLLRFNRAAEALLGEQDGLTLDRHGLHAATSALTAAFDRLVAKAGVATPEGGRLVLPRPSGRPDLTMVVSPLASERVGAVPGNGAVLAVITVPDILAPPAAPQLMERFGLTVAEAGLAVQLCAGCSLAEIAKQQRRSINTVRSHLARIMQKTNTGRQTALVQLLMQAG